MEVHYSKHHKTYFDKFVSAVEGSELETQSLGFIFKVRGKDRLAERRAALQV